MSAKLLISLITVVLLGLVLWLSRHELVDAWNLLSRVNVWVLLLIIPAQLVVYYAAGETMFSYLRRKSNVERISVLRRMRMSLEMNFVNHAFPSGGVSGMSYMTWRLKKVGVSASSAASAQLIRVAMTITASIALILVSLLVVTVDEGVNRWIILISSGVASVMLFGIIGIVYLVSSRSRMKKFASWLTVKTNRLAYRLSRGRKRVVLHEERILRFFGEMHDDYIELKRDYRLLRVPLAWATLFVLADASLFVITFFALGVSVNPAPIIIAYALASVAGFIVVTPGGAGVYEAIMVSFLAVAGIASGSAIAAILLTRVIVLLTIIVLGYLFYQHALVKYGKGKSPIQR